MSSFSREVDKQLKSSGWRLPTTLGGLLLLALATLALKLIVSSVTPILEDEAYFALWGVEPTLGYSEHPPMIGWIESLILTLGRAKIWIRLPAILTPILMALGLFALLRRLGANDRAIPAAALLLLSPLNLCYFFSTTDTPLMLSAFVAAAFLVLGLKEKRLTLFAVSGFGLGIAMLSKYFSALHLLAMGSALLIFLRGRQRVAAIAVWACAAVPAALITLYWNYTHGWMEVRYPFFRADFDEFNWTRPALFLLFNLILLCFIGADHLVRRLKTGISHWRVEAKQFGLLFLIPISILTVLATRKSIGLHWLLSFYPLLLPVVALTYNPDRIRQTARRGLRISLLIIAVLVSYSVSPIEWLHNLKRAQTARLILRPQQLIPLIDQIAGSRQLATTGYGVASLLEYYLPGRHVPWLGVGTHHGRNNDFVSDFRQWDRSDFLIFCRRPPETLNFENYFESIEVIELDIDSTLYWLVEADNFSYPAYRERVLKPIAERFHSVPSWIPTRSNPFRERYGL